jgi:hypothetical protein
MPHKTCATVAADVYVFALVCVMNSVVVPWLVVALLARRLEAAASMSTSTQRVRPPSMSALARRRFSLSDCALLGNAEGPLSTREHEHARDAPPAHAAPARQRALPPARAAPARAAPARAAVRPPARRAHRGRRRAQARHPLAVAPRASRTAPRRAAQMRTCGTTV